jgi:4-hydroxy-3-polyprenylbenzoate decarboxylase
LENDRKVHFVLSRGAHEVFRAEQGLSIPVDPEQQIPFWRERLKVESGELICHRWNDQSSSIASGSYRTKAMVIVPCSMGTVGRINAGIATDLIERCADVHLKERRPLVIAPRETPWNLIHLRNLTALAEAGATIAPPTPAWYTQPKSLNDMVDFLVIRLFDGLDEDLAPLQRWTGPLQ